MLQEDGSLHQAKSQEMAPVSYLDDYAGKPSEEASGIQWEEVDTTLDYITNKNVEFLYTT